MTESDELRLITLASSNEERNLKVTASREEMREFVAGYGSVIFKDLPAAELRRLRSN